MNNAVELNKMADENPRITPENIANLIAKACILILLLDGLELELKVVRAANNLDDALRMLVEEQDE